MSEAEAAGGLEEIAFQVRTKVKAASVMRFLSGDAGPKLIMVAQVVSQPASEFLNKAMKADRLSESLSVLASTAPDAPETAIARVACRSQNYRFISGRFGREAVASYTKMICNFADARWANSRLDSGEVLAAARIAVLSMARSWQRLLFYFQDPRWELFDICTPNDGASWEFDLNNVHQKVEALLPQEGESCDECCDVAFATEILRLYDLSPRAAFDFVLGHLDTLRISAASVERQHLLSAELKPSNARGLAVEAQKLGEVSYVKSVVAEAAAVSRHIQARVLKKHCLSRKQFVHGTRFLRLDGSRRSSKRAVKVHTKNTVKKRRAADPYRTYRSEHFSCKARVGSPAFVQEERRVREQWRALDANQKAIYAGAAVMQDEASADLEGKLTYDDICAAPDSLYGKDRIKNLFFHKVHEAIKNDPAWENSALGLSGPGTGLRVDKVLLHGGEKDIRADLDQRFTYDPVPIPNPGPSSPCRGCHQRLWGLCMACPCAEQAGNGVYNIYVLLSRWKAARHTFPRILRLSICGDVEDFVLTDTIGTGSTLLLVQMERVMEVPPEEGLVKACRKEVIRGEEMACCRTGQQCIRSIMRRVQQTPPEARGEGREDNLDVALVNATEVIARGGLAWKMGEVEHSATITLQARLTLQKKVEAASAPKLPFGMKAHISAEDRGEHLLAGGGPPEGDAPPPAAVVEQEGYDVEDVEEPASDNDDQAAKTVEHLPPEGVFSADVPAGRRVGICGHEYAATPNAKCIVCKEAGLPAAATKIAEGTFKFFFRTEAGKIEKSMHAACARSGAVLAICRRTHLEHSAQYLSHALDYLDKDEEKWLFIDICDLMRQALSAGAASSGAAAGSAAAPGHGGASQ